MSELDLRIALYFGTNGEPHAPEGMGWYLAATYPDHEGKVVEVIPRIRLSPQEMEKVAKVLDNFVNGKPMNWAEGENFRRGDSSLASVVASSNDQARDLVQQELAQAEHLIKQVEFLRARAGEFDAQS